MSYRDEMLSLSVSEFIQKMILYYPNLYKHKNSEVSKQKVLGILCGYGSSAEWDEKGNLALYFPRHEEYTLCALKSKYRDLQRAVEDYIQGVESTKESKRKLLEFDVLKARVRALNMPEETDEYIMWSKLDREYSPIMNIPDNIQPDWLEACRYVKEKLIEFYTEGIDKYISELKLKQESVYRKVLLKEYSSLAEEKQTQLKLCYNIKC